MESVIKIYRKTWCIVMNKNWNSAKYTKVNGSSGRVSVKDVAWVSCKMVPSTKVGGKRTNNVVVVDSLMPTIKPCMKETGTTIKNMAMVSTLGKTAVSTWAHSRTIKLTGMENTRALKVKSMTVNGSLIRNMEKAC